MSALWAYALRLLPWEMRRREVASIGPFLEGVGVDIGCGKRKARPGVVGLDLFAYPGVDLLADASALPFPSERLDYVCSIHSLEHCREPERVLREGLRALRGGGAVCLVLPDVRYTGERNTDRTEHHHRWSHSSFLDWLRASGLDGLIVKTGEACPRWSFYVVLRKPSTRFQQSFEQELVLRYH